MTLALRLCRYLAPPSLIWPSASMKPECAIFELLAPSLDIFVDTSLLFFYLLPGKLPSALRFFSAPSGAQPASDGLALKN